MGGIGAVNNEEQGRPDWVSAALMSIELEAAVRACSFGGFETSRTGRTDDRFRVWCKEHPRLREIIVVQAGGVDKILLDDCRRPPGVLCLDLQLKVGAASALCRIVSGQNRRHLRRF